MSSNERHGIAAAGNWITDHHHHIDVYPHEGTLANITEESNGGGGCAYNVLMGLAHLRTEIPLQAIGCIGEDADGRHILAHCGEWGIDTAQLRMTPDAPTSHTEVMNNLSNGARTFFHCRGANAVFAPEDIDIAAIDARICHLGYMLLLDRFDEPDAEYGTACGRFAEQLRAAGIRVSLDVVSEDSDRFRELVPPTVPHVDYLIVNEIEAGRSVGVEMRDGEDRLIDGAMETAARKLLDLGVGERVVIHAVEGALSMTRDETVWAASLELPAGWIKGSTGAGDAFCAGVLFGLHEGWATQKILAFGNAMAASSLRAVDATESIASLPEIEALAANGAR